MAVVETIWHDSPESLVNPDPQQAIDDLQNTLVQNPLSASSIDYDSLQGGLDFQTGGFGSDFFNDPDHFMYKDNWRDAGSSTSNTKFGYFMHTWIADDGQRYAAVVSWDEGRQQLKEERMDERVYRWSPSNEHKKTHRDQDVYSQATSKQFVGGGGSGWYTEAEIRKSWENGDMRQMESQGVTWDQYWGYVTGVDELVSSGALDYNNSSTWMENDAYRQLVTGLGIQTQYTDRGDVFNFNGFGYSRDYWADKTDAPIEMINAIGMSIAAIAAGGPLSAALQAAGMSASAAASASAAILSTTSQAVRTGDVDFTQALIAAVTAYGGAELAEALQGTGAIGEIGSKVAEFGDALVENGGDILTAAMSAGGISLVTQLVTEGEIDWQSAALAAAMAGGTVALKELLSGIGKPTDDAFLQELAEQDEWQQAAIDADIKDPFLNPNYKTVGDGLVMNINTNQVFGVTSGDSYGSMGDLDLDGDGTLTGSDLQNIDTTNEYVEGGIGTGDPGNPFRFDSQGNLIAGGSDYFREEGRYYVTENGVIYNASDVRYVDGGPNGTILVRDGQGNTFYVTDARYSAASGSFYNPETGTPIGVYGAYDPASGNVYDATTAGIEMTPIVDNTSPNDTFSFGRNPNIDDPNYYGTIYGKGVYGTNGITGAEGEFDLYFNRETNTYYTINVNGDVVPIDPAKLPPEVQDIAKEAVTEAATGPANNSTDAGGSSTTNATDSSPGNSGTSGGDAPKPADSYSQTFIQAIADATNQDIDRIIERINNGESPADIFNDPTGGNTVVTPTTGNTQTTPATSTGGGTNTGTQTSGEEGGDPDAQPKDGDPCTTADGRKGVIANGACVFVPSILSVDPSVWAGDDGNTGGNTNDNNSGGNNSGDQSGTTTTDAATPGKPDTGTTPGVLVVADDVWGTGTQGDGNTGSGDGTGDGEGDGDGSGGGGSGGEGAGRIVSGAQGSNTQWSPLYPGTKFRRFDKRARQGMMSQISQPNFSQDSRQNLYAGMFSDLMKGKA